MNRPARFASIPEYAVFTAAEFLRMIDAGAFADMRVELVDGDIVKMMPAYLAHGEANMRLGAKLLAAYGNDARVAVDLMIATAEGTIRAADLAVVRIDAPRDRPVDPQDVMLIVEIAGSSLVEDLGPKQRDYGNAGVHYYWVMDLAGQTLHAMSGPTPGGYQARQVVRFGEPLAVPGTDITIVID